MKALVVDPARCTGCHQCELACSFGRTGKFSPYDACLKVVTWEERGLGVPVVCLQCEDAPCEQVCPVGAIHRNPDTGAVEVDHARCLGCKMCFIVCPVGGIWADRYTGKAIKCDLCQGEPACVAVCAPEALRYEDVRLSGSSRKRQAAVWMRNAAEGEAPALPSGLKKLGG